MDPSIWVGLAGIVMTVGSTVLASAGAYVVGRRHAGAAPLIDPENDKPIIDMGRDAFFRAMEQRYGLTPSAPSATVVADASPLQLPSHPPLDANSAFAQLADMLKQALDHLAAKNAPAAPAPAAPPPSASPAA